MTQLHRFKNPEPTTDKISDEEFERLLDLQSDILNLTNNTNDCSALLIQLCEMSEQLTTGALASVMLLNRDDERLYVRSAPTIPEDAIEELNGLEIGSGSCGNAVYHNKPMFITDTLSDARWENTRDFAEQFSIGACWSVPLTNESDEVIGTFALSSFEKRSPSNFQRKLLETCAKVAEMFLQREQIIVQQKQMEEDAHRFEKLESIGVLAGGIAHDFNNLLSIVMGNLELVERSGELETNVADYITSASKASRKAADLTQQLLTFAKGGSPIKKISDLSELVKDSAEFVLHGSGVGLDFTCITCNISPLRANIDSGQISQVIQNIVINARQAMKDKGNLTIICDTVDLNNHQFKGIQPGRYHKIRIINTGPVISEELAEKIFDPYYTTKSDGNGLGLSLSYSIIKKHEGYIFSDQVTEGASFSIYLPVSEQPLEAITDEVYVTKGGKTKGLVLVMDDEEMLYEMTEQLLENLGYKAVHAADGVQAIEIYQQKHKSDSPIDAILMDLTIPGGMGGEEAVSKILDIDPNVKAIVSSGYSNDSVMANYRDYGFKGALSKPYKLNDLSEVLRSVCQ